MDPGDRLRGISDREIVDLANNSGRIVLTRDSGFLRTGLRRRIRYELIYTAGPAIDLPAPRAGLSVVRVFNF